MIILETSRLILKTWELTDAQAAFKLWSNAELMKYVGKPFESLEQTVLSLKKAEEVQAEKGFSVWATVEKHSGKIIGDCGFHQFDEESLEIVYHLQPEFWGQGLAGEAVSASIAYAFKNFDFPKIVGIVDVRHKASENVLRKQGFTFIETKVFDEMPEKLYLLKKENFYFKENNYGK